MEISPIARIFNDFSDKFAVPRQSSIINELQSKIVFEKEYACEEAVRGLDEFSHIWLIWEFDKISNDKFSPTVRPPRLGGNKRVGVFASRSPYRPNSLGLSSVKLDKIEYDKSKKPVLIVSGADLVSGTPIYDIKPYISYSDCKIDAVSGFADEVKDYSLKVSVDDKILNKISADKQKAIIKMLECDPRPAYQNDENRIYGFKFAGYEIKFKVINDTLIITEIEDEAGRNN